MMQAPAPVRWRGHAFGLAIEGEFELEGWPASEIPPGLPAARLELDRTGRLSGLLAQGGKAIARRRAPTGGWEPDVIRHPKAGYLLDEGAFGLYGVSPRGKHVSCAAPDMRSWRWQRHLLGRVLPFASTLRGLEPWHASAVVIDGHAVALAGPSEIGKTTLAVELMLRGAELLADDVLAMRDAGEEAHAYPGPGLMTLRRPTVQRLTGSELRRLGRRIGADSRSLRLAVSRREQPVRLAALYLLESAAESRRARLTRLEAPDPRSMLSCAFNLAVTAPARLLRQLDVCATVARSARVVRVAVPLRIEPRELARQISDDWEANLPGGR